MVHIVDECCYRFADVRAIEAVPHAVREPRDERALDLFLQVQDRVIALLPQRTAKGGHFVPGRPRERRVAPPAQRQRHDAANTWVEAHQVDKGVLGNPVDRKAGTVDGDIGQQRQRIDDVAERTGPHHEDAAHRAHRGKARSRVEYGAQTT